MPEKKVRVVYQAPFLTKIKPYKHVGIYAFRSQTLVEVCALPQSRLEQSEKLEQLRWLEAGYSIAVCETPCANIGIDTPEDLRLAEEGLKHQTEKNIDTL